MKDCFYERKIFEKVFKKYKEQIKTLTRELENLKEREKTILNEINQSILQDKYETTLFCNGCKNLSHICVDNTSFDRKYIHYCKLNNPCEDYKDR